jgi:hypothetical protein
MERKPMGDMVSEITISDMKSITPARIGDSVTGPTSGRVFTVSVMDR